jgi:isopenicillin-N N-acyltransferase-like protein
MGQSRRDFLAAAAAAAGSGLLACGESASSEASAKKEFFTAPASRSRYDLVKAEGTHRELGRQHGEQAVESIRAHADYIARTQQLSSDDLTAKALAFKPLFDQYCPHLLDEIEGLAEGAGITVAQALACNLRGELGRAPADGCTAYVIGRSGTAAGDVLIGQNSDMSQPNIEMGYVLHLKPKDKPQVLLWTFGGMIGYHGMNSAGVAHFANALGGGPAGQFGLSHYPVKRMMLECSTVNEVMDIFHRVPLASNGNYVLCDGNGDILDIEANSTGPQMIGDNKRGYIAHTNHYLCPVYATRENYKASLADSFPRLDKMNQMIETDMGRVDVARVKSYLSDHSNGEASICRHPRTEDVEKDFETAGRTVASMIAEPANRRMHVALGNPCQSEYVTYSMDA